MDHICWKTGTEWVSFESLGLVDSSSSLDHDIIPRISYICERNHGAEKCCKGCMSDVEEGTTWEFFYVSVKKTT